MFFLFLEEILYIALISSDSFWQFLVLYKFVYIFVCHNCHHSRVMCFMYYFCLLQYYTLLLLTNVLADICKYYTILLYYL